MTQAVNTQTTQHNMTQGVNTDRQHDTTQAVNTQTDNMTQAANTQTTQHSMTQGVNTDRQHNMTKAVNTQTDNMTQAVNTQTRKTTRLKLSTHRQHNTTLPVIDKIAHNDLTSYRGKIQSLYLKTNVKIL